MIRKEFTLFGVDDQGCPVYTFDAGPIPIEDANEAAQNILSKLDHISYVVIFRQEIDVRSGGIISIGSSLISLIKRTPDIP